MIVGLDYRPALFQAFGIGRYVRNLVRALLDVDPDLQLVLAGLFLRGQRERTGAHQWPDPSRARYVGARIPARALPILARFGWRADGWLGPLDVFHDTDYALTPVRCRARVVTLYDTAYFAERGFVSPAQARKMLKIVRAQLRGEPEIITISEVARDDLVRAFDLDPARVHVTPLGADPRFFAPRTAAEIAATKDRHRISRPYTICLGTLEPRKNVGRLVQALSAVRKDGLDLDLILVGRRGHRSDEVFREIAAAGLHQHVRWLGTVSDDDAACLVRGSVALAFPTLHEGFGLPAIEGLASGVPVIASSLPVMREVCGDAALLFDPLDVRAMADALARAATATDAAVIAARGLARARQFTWEACARTTLAAYRAARERCS